MHKKLIKRKIYKKYGLDCEQINDEFEDHIYNLDKNLKIYYDISYDMYNFQTVNKKLIEFTNLIYDDGRNMSLYERIIEYYCKPIKNKPKTKKNCL